MTKIPIGILGGTFDPVHFGHLRLALEVRQQLQLEAAMLVEAVRLVPLYLPPHREAPVAAAAQRLRMLQLAVANTGELIVDDCELARQGTSYTIDTVRSLRERLPSRSLCLIIGADAFRKLDTWRDWSALLDYVHLIVVDRAGQDLDFHNNPALEQLYTSRLTDDNAAINAATAGMIIRINAPLLEISSTVIRGRIRRGDNIKFLLPDAVITYIDQESLYR